MCPRIPSAFMTFCLARESANRVKGHTQRPFPTKERPPEMLILTPEHGITEECRNLDCLDLDGALEGLSLLGGLGLGLGTHDAATPVALGLLVLLGVTLLDGLDELGKLGLVLGANLGDGADGGGLVELLVQITCVLTLKFRHTFLWTTVPRRALPLMMA